MLGFFIIRIYMIIVRPVIKKSKKICSHNHTPREKKIIDHSLMKLEVID